MFEKLGANSSALLEMSKDQLKAMFGGTPKTLAIGEAPLVGRYISIGSEHLTERSPKVNDLKFDYEWAESGPDAGRLMRISIGAPHTGPLLSCYLAHDMPQWGNVYGGGDHGVDCTRGGTWHSDSNRHFPCLADAVADRDYLVDGLTMHRSRLVEGPALLEALQEAAALCAGNHCENSQPQ
jgi:hypothetical protein